MMPTRFKDVFTSRRWLMAAALSLTVLGMMTVPVRAGTFPVPNGSFELPATVFVDTNKVYWEQSPTPFWYDEINNGPWQNLAGVFLNQAPTNASYIDNMDGSQAAYLWASPSLALFQDYDSVYGTNTAPQHDFDARFEVGKLYQLTVGVIGGGGGMSNGVTMELSLYYRDDASNQVTVAATTITNNSLIFSNTTHFVDFSTQLPTVMPGDAWAGRHIGVQLLSTVGFDLLGGYWDVDNVRLTTVQSPIFQNPAHTNGQFQFTLLSEPGLKFEVLGTTNVTLPISNWIGLGTLTNATGTILFTDPAGNFSQRFYQTRQLP